MAGVADTPSPEPSDRATAAIRDALENSASRSESGVVVTVNTADTTERIRKADATNRAEVLKAVAANLDATEAALARLRREGLDMKSRGRARFNEAYDIVRTRESELRQHLRDARRALPDAVSDAQAQLARSYESYAQAVAQIEATIRSAKETAAHE